MSFVSELKRRKVFLPEFVEVRSRLGFREKLFLAVADAIPA